jgi:hypothetical protein
MSMTGMYQLLREAPFDRLLLLKHSPTKAPDPDTGLQDVDHRASIGRSCLLAQELLTINEPHRLYMELDLPFARRLQYLSRSIEMVKQEVGKQLPELWTLCNHCKGGNMMLTPLERGGC